MIVCNCGSEESTVESRTIRGWHLAKATCKGCGRSVPERLPGFDLRQEAEADAAARLLRVPVGGGGAADVRCDRCGAYHAMRGRLCRDCALDQQEEDRAAMEGRGYP